ncbi:hypothetical protein [Paraburkholderia sp. SIMBA_054]|uniref:hypothetical protein n=1 Tax=Paraburkholderia sp. SIMBA_054 TaxID=3085795 RepID=UPI00397B7ECD
MKSESKSTSEIRHLRSLRQQLGDIDRSLRARRLHMLGPRAARSMLSGWAICVGTCAAMVIAPKVGMQLPPGTFWVGLAGGLLVMFLVGRFSTAPQTHTEKVGLLLKAYDPVDVEAYIELERRVRRFPGIDSDIAYHWLRRERSAVNEAIRRHKTRRATSALHT